MFLRRPTFFVRFAVCLLAVLQGVAVSWHVCDLGGPHPGGTQCHPMALSEANGAPCHAEDDPTRAWRMTLGEVPRVTDASHCLAALLSTTPAQTSQAFALSAVFVAHELPREAPRTHLCDAAPCGIGARGPPVFS